MGGSGALWGEALMLMVRRKGASSPEALLPHIPLLTLAFSLITLRFRLALWRADRKNFRRVY